MDDIIYKCNKTLQQKIKSTGNWLNCLPLILFFQPVQKNYDYFSSLKEHVYPFVRRMACNGNLDTEE